VPAPRAASWRRGCRRTRAARSPWSRSAPTTGPAAGRPSWPTRTASSRRRTTGATWRAPGPRRAASTCPGGGCWGVLVTNGAIALRGHPEHYDEWDALVDGYGWESWLPWFRAIECDRDFGDAPWHDAAGPIPISRYPRPGWLELQERFCEAALAAGHEWVDDHNAPDALGIGPIPLNMIDGLRQTPADRYLDPAWGGPT
jgi:choline dehydrogenase